MFDPLRELLLDDPQALIADTHIVGEKAGRLFGSREQETYTALGGVVYPPLRGVREEVVAWGSASVAETCGDVTKDSADAATVPLAEGGDAAAAAAAALTSSSLHSLGDGEASWWDLLAVVADIRSRSRRGVRRSWLHELSAAAPHILPDVARSLVKSASLMLPGLRSVYPTAILGARRRLPSTMRSQRGCPERVTGLCFHPVCMWLAVAVDEGGADATARVVVFDVADGRVVCVLTHSFQRDVSWLQWKPRSRDTIAVGCRGGVLLWSVRGGAAAATAATMTAAKAATHTLFYGIHKGFRVDAAAFAHRDANMLACISATDTRLFLLRLDAPPFAAQASGAVVVPSVDGGLGEVLFDDDDHFLLCTVRGHASLAMVRTQPPSSASAAEAGAALLARVVPTPAPVGCIARATGLGPSVYFLSTAALEGVLVARVNPFVGIEVVAMISTGLHRGIGGCVTRFVCSRRRLWVQTETGHLLVCHYGLCDGAVSVIPVGVAALEAAAMAAFAGCDSGSLVAAAEADGTVHILPSYHA
ncbi:hypothetical protein NESM_000736200 [Novymonas esmeraldas]|uniref:Uncharacterized protein n=1 Tax=Novymonas esmeraldas TaxID=1808958 RepID=A0AAW0EVR1_9TRYP